MSTGDISQTSPLSLSLSKRTQLLLAVGFLFSAALLAALILLTPAYGLPVGTAVADGDSMGHDSPQVVVYADTGEIQTGDVIVFAAGGEYLRHRVVGESQHGYVTKGDANPTMDQPGYPHATEGNIRGVTVAAAPLGAVQGGLLGLLALLGLAGAWIYRRRLTSSLRLSGEWRARISERLQQLGAVAFCFLLISSMIGGVAIIGTQPLSPEQSGTASAVIENSTYVQSKDVSSQTTGPADAYFNPDGTKMYVAGRGDNSVHEYHLSNPYDISTASYDSSKSVAGSTVSLNFNNDGTEMYITTNGETAYQYSLSTAWDVSTASQTGSYDFSANVGYGPGIEFNDDGTKMYISDYNNDNIDSFSLSTAWDVSTASHIRQADISSQTTSPTGGVFNGDGTKIFIPASNSNRIDEWDLSTAYDISTISYSGNSFDTSGQTSGSGEGITKANKGEKLYLADSGNNQIHEYDTTGSGHGVTVDGYVTDSDGNSLDAAVTLEQDGVEVASTTTNSSGGYKFDTVEDGSYTLVAEADGYVTESESITVSGAPVTQDLTLGGNFGGVVEKRDGSPCSDCMVELWMVNDSNTTVDAGETVEDAQSDVIDNVSRAVPRDLYQPDMDPVEELLQADGRGEAVLVHSPDAWREVEAEADIPMTDYRYTVYSTGNNLGLPTTQVEPGETYIASCWEPKDGGVAGRLENAVDNSIDPGRTTDCNITVEQIGPGNSTVNKQELETTHSFTTGASVYQKNHHAVELTLSEGYWRLSSTESPKTTIIRSGSPEDLPRTIEHNLEDYQGNPADIAQEIQQKIDAGQFDRTTVSTDKNGRFKYPVPDGYSTVAVTAFSGEGLLETYQDPTVADLRTEIERDDYNRSVYISQKPVKAHPPDTNVTVTVREVTNPTFEDIESYLGRLQWFQELIDTEHYTDVEGYFTDNPGSVSKGDLENRTATLAEIISQQNELLNSVREEQDNYDDTVNNPSDATDSELRETLEAQQKALEEQTSTIENLRDSVKDLEEQENGSTLLSMEIPFKSNNLEAEGTAVMVQWDNGSSTMMPEQYWSVSSGSASDPSGSIQHDYVQIEEYPIPSDVAVANIRVVTATEEGVSERTERVSNPGFSGQVPAINAISANTLRPGPSDRVQLEIDPAERSSYQSIKSAEVFGPNGSELTASVSGDSVEFNTAGHGNHLVKLTVEDTDGNTYVEPLRIKAGSQDAPMPPGVRVREGILGTHALAGDGVDTARVRVDDGSGTAHIGAVFPEGHDGRELHVYTGEALTRTAGTYNVRVLRGEEQQAGGKMEVTIHTPALQDGSHVYRDGSKPITQGEGTSAGRVTHNADGSRIQTYTGQDGTVSVEYNNAPGWGAQARWWVLTTIPGASDLPGANVSPVGVVLDTAAGVGETLLGYLPDISTVQSGFTAPNPGGVAL